LKFQRGFPTRLPRREGYRRRRLLASTSGGGGDGGDPLGFILSQISSNSTSDTTVSCACCAARWACRLWAAACSGAAWRLVPRKALSSF
jgi:hypothetical protein